jgi:hypothetical protein
MARGFDTRSPDPHRWRSEERLFYQLQVKKIGLPTLIVNALDVGVEEGAFGGAMILSSAGALLAESPHGQDASLVYEMRLE